MNAFGPFKRSAPRHGQSTVEYMLVISVVVMGMFFAFRTFFPSFEEGYDGLMDDVDTVLTSGTRDGSGNTR